ncbi:MAG: leucine-rich repeat domain-containing protein, partial [Candidatus Hermodarchaeota archaeon]
MSQRYVKFSLEPKQEKALKKLNKIVGKEIPCLDEKGIPAFGFKVEDNAIISLWLYRCDLKEFPNPILKFDSLQELYLPYNFLTNIPESIDTLQALKNINLKWNLLETLQENIGNLNSLEKLKLDSNKLSHLPKSVKNLSSL